MSFEIPDPNQELVHGPGDRADDVENVDHREAKFHLSEAIDLSSSFEELISVIADQSSLTTDEGTNVMAEDVIRLLRQLAALEREEPSVSNENAIHSLVLELPNITGLVDKVIKLLNPGEEEEVRLAA